MNYLIHHGIKGQEWGVKHGPPYPLAKEKHAKVVRKAEKDDGYNTKNRIKALIGYYKPGDNNPYISEEKKIKREKEYAESEATKKKTKEAIQSIKQKYDNLSPKKKAVLIGAGIAAGTALTAFLLYKYGNKNYSDFDRNYMRRVMNYEFNPDSLDDLDKVFNTGHVFHHMSSVKVKDLKLRERLYVSTNEADSNRYKTVLPRFFKDWQDRLGLPYEGDYNFTYKALNEIKSPSAKKRFEYYVELLTEHMKAFADEKSIREYAKNTWPRFAQELSDVENPDTKKYYQKIIDNGYNAIIDDNDLGKLAKEPLIILKPSENIVQVGMEEIKGLKKTLARIKLRDL